MHFIGLFMSSLLKMHGPKNKIVVLYLAIFILLDSKFENGILIFKGLCRTGQNMRFLAETRNVGRVGRV